MKMTTSLLTLSLLFASDAISINSQPENSAWRKPAQVSVLPFPPFLSVRIEKVETLEGDYEELLDKLTTLDRRQRVIERELLENDGGTDIEEKLKEIEKKQSQTLKKISSIEKSLKEENQKISELIEKLQNKDREILEEIKVSNVNIEEIKLKAKEVQKEVEKLTKSGKEQKELICQNLDHLTGLKETTEKIEEKQKEFEELLAKLEKRDEDILKEVKKQNQLLTQMQNSHNFYPPVVFTNQQTYEHPMFSASFNQYYQHQANQMNQFERIIYTPHIKNSYYPSGFSRSELIYPHWPMNAYPNASVSF